MFAYIIFCLNIFFIVLDVIVLLYLFRNIFPGHMIKLLIDILVAPILAPTQRLVRRSILNCYQVDISPYILLIILGYLQNVCTYFLQ